VNSDLRHLAEQALKPLKQWSRNCHAASVALVKSGAIPGARVARGSCRVVPGQHSWVTIGDPYASNVVILDPTLWSYTLISPEVYVGNRNKWNYRPHGSGSIFTWGRPPEAKGRVVKLKPPAGGWSADAKTFLEMLGPLDEEGWKVLAHAPVQGWPAAEILSQLYGHPVLGVFIPVDIVGMVIGEDCNGLYPRS
jgi:hypothetical protein